MKNPSFIRVVLLMFWISLDVLKLGNGGEWGIQIDPKSHLTDFSGTYANLCCVYELPHRFFTL
jgi:hypothetical protein